MFGGTWTQIKDKFILVAGDSYTNGSTGGASTVTLSVSNMPSHKHSFTPSGTVGSHTHTGPSHSHSFTPSGTVSSSFSGAAGTTGNQSTNPTFSGSHGHRHQIYNSTDTNYPLTYYWDIHAGATGARYNAGHFYATDDSGYIYTYTKTVTISGTTVGNHVHSFIPSGTVSSSFSGTAGYTDTSGSGTSFSILPPYVVKYCWERTA